jgi:hypothetical protein
MVADLSDSTPSVVFLAGAGRTAGIRTAPEKVKMYYL